MVTVLRKQETTIARLINGGENMAKAVGIAIDIIIGIIILSGLVYLFSSQSSQKTNDNSNQYVSSINRNV